MAAIPVPWRVRRAWESFRLRRPRFGSATGALELSGRKGRASLIAVGDLSLEAGPFRLDSLRPLFESADLRVGNLETVLSAEGEPAGRLGSFLRARPESVASLVEAGFDAVTVANNHCLDFGARALRDSLGLLDRSGIAHTGAGNSPDDARKPVIVERKGLRIGLLSYCDDYCSFGREPGVAVVAESRPDLILDDLARLRSRVDLLVVQLHWGYEFQLYPMLGHRDRARQYADAGADLVLCHHAHVPMGVERWNRSLVAHGLGNFLFPAEAYMRSGHAFTDRSFALEVRFDEKGVTAARLHPTIIREGGIVEPPKGAERSHMLRVFDALRRGLRNDRLLARIEVDRTAREAIRLVRLLAELAADKDPRFDEAAASLRLPRQSELISRLHEMPGAKPMGKLLEAAAEGDSARCRDSVPEAALAALRERYCRSPILPGRTP